MIQAILQNKVVWGIALTFVIGGLTAIQTVSPAWGGAITMIVAMLTTWGHTNNIIKGVREQQ